MLQQRIAVVTDELVGLNKGGGIGTCSNALTRVLLSAGYDVEVIITDQDYKLRDATFHGARVRSLRSWLEARNYTQIDHVVLAYGVYEMLRSRDYTAVHFNDWRGSGFFYAMAKRQGLVEAVVISHTHGPSKWVRTYNLELADIDSAELDTLENSQIENSDYVISPSQYLLDWYNNQGIKLPNARVINWMLPKWLDAGPQSFTEPLRTRSIEPGSITEIVFFGRQERRKGFDLFVSAVMSEPRLRNINLTFLGRFDRIEREFTGSRALYKLKNHSGAIRFLNNFDHEQAFVWLQRREHALVVMPSLIENSPCTVGECFTIGIPFIATAVGGTPELFSVSNNSLSLVADDPRALAEHLASTVEKGMPEVVSRLEPSKIVTEWLAFHEMTTRRKKVAKQSFSPMVSVCLVHHNRPSLLRRALTALSQQTYQNFEVILVDDGSDALSLRQLQAIEAETWPFLLKVIKSQGIYLGAARNLGAKYAEGTYLIFHDDDNVALPYQIEMFVNAAEAGKYDILTAQYYVFDDSQEPSEGKITYFPIGVGGSFSYFRNRFGDANAIIKKDIFERLGGFSEAKGVGWEDWELFLRAHMAGMRLGLVPEPLFCYRVSDSGMLSTTSPILNHARIIKAVASAAPPTTAELLEFAKRDSINQAVLDRTWALLGKREFSDLHQQLIALPPNSEEARQTLMELAFAMGRHADAVELGLLLKQGFKRVSALLGAMSNRIASPRSVSPKFARTVVREEPVVLIKGWLGPDDSQTLIADQIIHDGEVYEILQWAPELRLDVNSHFDLMDDRLRGFHAIGVGRAHAPRRMRSPFALHRGTKSESVFTVRLNGTTSTSGKTQLRFPDAVARRSVIGHSDTIILGRIIEVQPRAEHGKMHLNRVTIEAEPRVTVYLVFETGLNIISGTTDDDGRVDFVIFPDGDDEVESHRLGPILVFIAGANVNASAIFYARQ